MMTNEDTPDSKDINTENSPDLADKKAQMLVIYLPEGSVIVDRSDVNLATVPQAVVEQIAPKAEVSKAALNETRAVEVQSTLQEVVQLAVAEVLRITGTPLKPIQSVEPSENKIIEETVDSYSAPRRARRVHVRGRRRKINWVHDINIISAVFIAIAVVMPSILSSAFGLVIYASKSSHPNVLIFSGDLMVSKVLPASQLNINDLLLVRNPNSWKLAVRQVTSNSTNGVLSTITTASSSGGGFDNTYVLASDARSYKVSQVIPKLGYIPIVLTSGAAKGVALLALLILNLTVYIRRSRKRRFGPVIR